MEEMKTKGQLVKLADNNGNNAKEIRITAIVYVNNVCSKQISAMMIMKNVWRLVNNHKRNVGQQGRHALHLLKILGDDNYSFIIFTHFVR